MAKVALLAVTVLLSVVAGASALDAKNCAEMPECLNEYQWKHKATVDASTAFCKDRYPTCNNSDGRDMKQFCPQPLHWCNQLIWDYLGRTDDAKTKVAAFCKERFPRCA